MKRATIYEEYFNEQDSLEKEYGKDSVVLMMVGSFYELYGLNLPNKKVGKIDVVHDILGMSVTKTNKTYPHSETNPYMMGFPDYALDEHLGKLLRANITVAIYDQFSVAGTTKKERRRTHVYTPSTFIDDANTNSNCLVVCELAEFKSAINHKTLKKVHLAMLCLSTGKIELAQIYDTPVDTTRVESEIYRFIHSWRPCEIIYCGAKGSEEDFIKINDLTSPQNSSRNVKIYCRSIPKEYTKVAYQNEFLHRVYQTESTIISPIDHLGLDKYNSLIPHLILALQFAFEQDKRIINRICHPRIIESVEQLILGGDSIYQLNLIDSPFDISTTLFDIVCKAKTPMGKRLVRHRILNPTTNVDELNKRYTLINEMTKNYEKYGEMLLGICDIEKKYRKIVLHTIQPFEFAELKETFSGIKKLFTYLKDSLFSSSISPQLINTFESFYNEYKTQFNFVLMKKCKLNDIKGSFFKRGTCSELDSLEDGIQQNMDLLSELAKKLSVLIDPGRDDLVKIESTDKEGWYLGITTSRFKKLPNGFDIPFEYHGKKYILKRSILELTNLTNTVKIRSPEIRLISQDILSKRERMDTKILEEYYNCLDHFVNKYPNLFNELANVISEIDFIYSSTKVAVENGYVRPVIEVNESASYLDIRGLRHPIIEKINQQEEYIVNDVSLGVNDHYGSIIMGLNMSGKTCLLRSIGCNIVMAQAGMYVSCGSMRYSPFNKLMSKMTIRDNMGKGQSTFAVELMQIKSMLMGADSHTLILSDELCSSTESTSGHAIVAQTLHELSMRGVKFMFSTHLHQLQQIPIIVDDERIKFFHFMVRIGDDGSIIFDRKLTEGGMTELYGLEVAKALGLPIDFIKGAYKIRDLLLRDTSELVSIKASRYNKGLYMHECNECGAKERLHTHHKRPQKEANEKGLIDGRFNKNARFNLEVLCEDCHEKRHQEHLHKDH